MKDRDAYLDYFVKNETHMGKFNPIKMVTMFGQNVARLRSESGFTQKELSRMTSINESTLVRIELGNIQRINMIDAMKLANFFHMPLIVMCGEGNDLYDLYANLIRSSARTQRLVNCILQADVSMSSLQSDFDPNDLITRITFGQPVKDGINTSRFLFEHDNISLFRNYPWYHDAYALLEINSTFYHPLYHLGDRLVLVDRAPSDGEIGVYIKENHMYIRRLVSLGDVCRLEFPRQDTKITELILNRKNPTDMKGIVRFGTVVAVI